MSNEELTSVELFLLRANSEIEIVTLPPNKLWDKTRTYIKYLEKRIVYLERELWEEKSII
jgi:hypothetical protein